MYIVWSSYWPASPSNGAIVDEPNEGLYIQRWGDSGDSRYGDAHLYPQVSLSLSLSLYSLCI